MTRDIAKQQICLLIREGIEIWLDKENQSKLEVELENKECRFLKINDKIINKADVVGIFPPEDMEARTRRKNGQWKCFKGNWHDRNEKCEDRVSCSTCKGQCAKEFCQCACHGKQ